MEEWLGPLMFFALLVMIFTGFPVAFALGGTAILFAFIGVEVGLFDWSLLLALPDRTFGIMANQVLLAVPFFIFMGTMLAKSRLAEDLLTTVTDLAHVLRTHLNEHDDGGFYSAGVTDVLIKKLDKARDQLDQHGTEHTNLFLNCVLDKANGGAK